jgi:Zn-dependent metalloprotease
MNERHPLQCIIPPHLARKLAESADPNVRARALRALALAERLRGRRDILSAMALPAPAGEKHRTIYDARKGTDLPGRQVRDEGDSATGDPAADEAYDGLGATYDLYYEEYQRNSLDGHGLRLDATVHYGVDFDNAFWDGRQMVFGDGDGVIFNRFTICLDVIGHELTHGVTQFTAGLSYHDQTGALNESMSDVFGSLVKQRANNQDAADADWLIGAGLFTSKVNGKALRSMEHPGTAYDDPQLGKDPQPDHMRNYVHTVEDSGGVHLNSGIPNRAFCLAAKAIGGNAWVETGLIWYKALLRLPTEAQFTDAATITFQVAGEEFGTGSAQQQAVLEAWSEVGVKVAGVRASGQRKRVAHSHGNGNGAHPAPHLDKIMEELGKRLIEVVSKASAAMK